MDIQLFTTDEELKEFPENKTDPDTTSSPNSINLSTTDLPRSHTDLPKSQSGLPIKKARHRHRTKGSHRCKFKSNSKNSLVNHSVIQVNDCLAPIQGKQSIIQTFDMAYLSQLLSQSLIQPVVAPPVVSQSGVDQSGVDQPSCPIPPLLSLQLQPNLNALTQTLSPQALRYVHLGIQIGWTLSN